MFETVRVFVHVYNVQKRGEVKRVCIIALIMAVLKTQSCWRKESRLFVIQLSPGRSASPLLSPARPREISLPPLSSP
jgi:hypothetical protein